MIGLKTLFLAFEVWVSATMGCEFSSNHPVVTARSLPSPPDTFSVYPEQFGDCAGLITELTVCYRPLQSSHSQNNTILTVVIIRSGSIVHIHNFTVNTFDDHTTRSNCIQHGLSSPDCCVTRELEPYEQFKVCSNDYYALRSYSDGNLALQATSSPTTGYFFNGLVQPIVLSASVKEFPSSELNRPMFFFTVSSSSTCVDGTTDNITTSVPSTGVTTSVPSTGVTTSVPTNISENDDDIITDTTNTSNTRSSMSAGAITGVVIAILLLLVALIVLAAFIIVRWEKIFNAIKTQRDTLPSPTIPKDYHSRINTIPNSSYISSTAASRAYPSPSTPNKTYAPVYDEIPPRPDPLNGDYSYAYAHTPKDCRFSASDGSVGSAATSDKSDEMNDDSTPDQPTEQEQTVVVYI